MTDATRGAPAGTTGRQIGWLEALNPRYWHTPSVVALIVANLIPLIGVIFWQWDLFLLMTAYWAETGIIGLGGLIRIAMVSRWAALFYVPFFCIHFGGFMAGHFVFIYTLFADPAVRAMEVGAAAWVILIERGLWVALVAMFISHGISFFFNFLRPWWRGLVPADTSNNAMSAPYSRVIVLHVTLLFGAVLVEMFQTKAAAFVLLIALKIVTDIAAHVRANVSALDAAAVAGGSKQKARD
jgi:hypothetical protein